jgi:transcriptional regulator with XRE-family HTH domain
MRKYAAHRRAIVAVLREAREKAGLSQRALSEKLGEHVTYVHEIETDQHSVRTEEFIAIAQALGIDPTELLARVVKRKG